VRRIGRGDFGPASTPVRTGPAPPGPPRTAVAREVTSETIMLCWGAPENDNGLTVSSYVVEMKLYADAADEFKEVYRGAEPVFVATGLVPNKIHVFRVAAANRLGKGAWASRAAFRTAKENDDRAQTGWVECLDQELGTPFFYHPPTKQYVERTLLLLLLLLLLLAACCCCCHAPPLYSTTAAAAAATP